MAEKLYRILISGRPIKGRDPLEVIRNLTTLLKSDPARVRGLLTGKPSVLRRGVDGPTAKRMIEALTKAGMGSKAEPDTPSAATPPSAAAASPPEAGFNSARGARTVNPELGPLSIDYTTIPCSQIANAGNTLDFHKPGARNVPYSDILLMAAYDLVSKDGSERKLMVFTTSSKRPFVLNANNIKYWGFPGIGAESSTVSLRRFIGLVHANNRAMVIDEPTRSFLHVAMPRELKLDETALATALGQVLDAKGMFRDKANAQTEQAPDMSEMLITLNQAAAQTTARDPRTSALVRTGILLVALMTSVVMLAFDLTWHIRLIKLYRTFLKGEYWIINNLTLWPSVAFCVTLMALALWIVVFIARKNHWTQWMANLYAWTLSSYALFRLSALIIAMSFFKDAAQSKRLTIPYAYATATSKQPILTALLSSWTATVIPASIIIVIIFCRSPHVSSRFQG